MPLRLPCRRWEAGQVHPLWWPGVRPTDLSHATRESSVSRVILQRREAKSRRDHRPRRPQQRGEEVVEVDMALTRGADHTREDLLGPCAAGRPIPATDLAIDDGGADGVFSAPVGRVDVGGPQEGEHSRELAVEMPGEALGRRQSGRRVDEPAQAGKQAPAGPSEALLGDRVGMLPAPVELKSRARSPLRRGTANSWARARAWWEEPWGRPYLRSAPGIHRLSAPVRRDRPPR